MQETQKHFKNAVIENENIQSYRNSYKKRFEEGVLAIGIQMLCRLYDVDGKVDKLKMHEQKTFNIMNDYFPDIFPMRIANRVHIESMEALIEQMFKALCLVPDQRVNDFYEASLERKPLQKVLLASPWHHDPASETSPKTAAPGLTLAFPETLKNGAKP
jgi:hypothetical protein